MNILFLSELVTPNVNLGSILPELVVALAGTIAMVYDSFFPKDRVTTSVISLVGLAASAVLLVMMWGDVQPAGAWNGMIAHDNLRLGFSFVFLLVSAMTVLISSVWVERENVPSGEYNALLMFDVRHDAHGVG